MKKIDKYKDREWNDLASILSEENTDNSALLGRFVAEDSSDTVKKWKDLRNMRDKREIDVDKAWHNVFARIQTDEIEYRKEPVISLNLRSTFLRIAAMAAVILVLGTVTLWMMRPDFISKKISVATNSSQKNLKIDLPDGSKIYLNRNSGFTYRMNFGKNSRRVRLTGEAFFEIAPDKTRPFIIDAGKANVKVVGTSFNVITSNTESAVEVFVKTGKVMLTGSSDKKSISLEPGDIGTMGTAAPLKKINSNPNYLSWNTGLLVYNGQKLDIVFNDLKRVYNMNIIADDPSILENRWTSPIDNQPQETIIRLICASFNLSYTRDGDIYHLVMK